VCIGLGSEVPITSSSEDLCAVEIKKFRREEGREVERYEGSKMDHINFLVLI
jgi:hypothetical protein